MRGISTPVDPPGRPGLDLLGLAGLLMRSAGPAAGIVDRYPRFAGSGAHVKVMVATVMSAG
jgi:hypothetical protein